MLLAITFTHTKYLSILAYQLLFKKHLIYLYAIKVLSHFIRGSNNWYITRLIKNLVLWGLGFGFSVKVRYQFCRVKEIIFIDASLYPTRPLPECVHV